GHLAGGTGDRRGQADRLVVPPRAAGDAQERRPGGTPLLVLRAGAELGVEGEPLAVAHDVDHDAVAHLVLGDGGGQIVVALRRAAVEGDDAVALPQAGPFGRAVLDDLVDLPGLAPVGHVDHVDDAAARHAD